MKDIKDKINPATVRANVWRWRQDHGKERVVTKVKRAKPILPPKVENVFVSSADLAKIHRQAAGFGQGIPL